MPSAAFSGGDGTTSDPWQVSTIDELQAMGDNATTLAGHYILINDIDASATFGWNFGEGFEPIGPSFPSNAFTGSFDMMGYNIADITIDRTSDDYQGLFGYVYNAEIKNGTFSGSYVEGNTRVGTLAGRTGGTTTIDNIIIDSGVVVANGNQGGGIVGLAADNTQITQCDNSASVGVGGNSGGGIVGEFTGDNIVINKCINRGTVTVTGADSGGISGTMVATTTGTFSNSYNHGSVSAISSNAAGLIGSANNIDILYSYNKGTVNSGTGHGGAVGTHTGSTATSVYWDTETSGRSTSALGEGKTTNEMLVRSTFVNWDFVDTWESFGSYPVLQWEGIDGYSVDPFIMSPANGTVTNTTYPPLETAISFSWSAHDNADSSTYTIARDSNYNTVVASGTITSFSRNVNLPGGDYYFRVRYNFDDGSSSSYSESQFSIDSTGADFGTAVQGVVYQSISGSQTPLSGALVRIYNDTWSDNYVTAGNGYYLFNTVLTNTTYYIVATRDGYTDSTLNTVTLQTNTTSTKNIVMQRETAPTYIMPHYVRFVVKSLFGGVYEGVTVTVYEGDSATALFTQTTGSDGAVGFELSENIQYRLTLYSETDNIDTTYTVTPTKESYSIYVSLTGSSQAQQEADVILYGMHTDGNELNVTWNDTSGLTTLTEITVKNRDGTTAYYLTSTSSNSYVTQEVNTTANSTYIVELSIESGGLSETFIRSHVITFDEGVKPAFDLGFTDTWQSMFLAALSIIFLAVLFGSANAHLGAILISIAGLFHVFITGWIPTTVLTVAMMFIALIVSVSFYMRKAETVK